MKSMISVFFSLFILSSVSVAMSGEQTQGTFKASSYVGKINISCDNCRKLHAKCSSRTPCDKCISLEIPCIRSERINCRACYDCRLNHRACDPERPCRNCLDLGLECVQRNICQSKKTALAQAKKLSKKQAKKPKKIEASKNFIWINYDFKNTFPSDESSEESSDELLDDYNSRGETQEHESERSEDFFPYLNQIFSNQ